MSTTTESVFLKFFPAGCERWNAPTVCESIAKVTRHKRKKRQEEEEEEEEEEGLLVGLPQVASHIKYCLMCV